MQWLIFTTILQCRESPTTSQDISRYVTIRTNYNRRQCIMLSKELMAAAIAVAHHMPAALALRMKAFSRAARQHGMSIVSVRSVEIPSEDVSSFPRDPIHIRGEEGQVAQHGWSPNPSMANSFRDTPASTSSTFCGQEYARSLQRG
jgi:hypothetical protein